ncbi:MAG: hypothetical protein HFF50_04545 [Lawsonibacter sp.]|nr:hypothetical protein [Lawsonibacter sp.]
MGLFDWRRGKEGKKANSAPPEWPKPPREDTMVMLLMDRVLPGGEAVVEFLRKAVGADAVGQVCYRGSHVEPLVPEVTVKLGGLEFWCSYLPFPVPKQDRDISAAAQYNLFLKPEEREAFAGHKSFWALAQKGGGTSLEGKRRVCWQFSLLCAALLEQEGTVGVSVINTALLVSRENYLFQCTQMEGRTWNDPDYFPVTLWIWLYRGLQEDKPTVETQGLAEFGLPELGFFHPKLPVQDLLNYLFTMSSWQITGKQLYRNMALIPLTPEREVVCKQTGETLYFIGA